MLKKIVVIDDQPDQTKLISASLKKLAIESDTYNDSEQALEALIDTEILPDGIFLDIVMPKMNGYEFLSKLFTDKRFKRIPVILITGAKELPTYATEEFDGFPITLVHKPLNVRDMLLSIADMRKKLS